MTDGLKHAICVSMQANGSPVKIEGTDLESFPPIIESASITWMNCTVENVKTDAEKISGQLGFDASIVPALLSGFYASYEDVGTTLGLLLPSVAVNKFEVYVNPLLVLVKKNMVLTIHDENVKRLVRFSRYADIFMKKIPIDIHWNDKLTIVLSRIIDENNERNFEGLRSIQEQGDEMAKFLLDPTTPRAVLGGEIYKMKHGLVTYLNVLWATVNAINSLRYGDAELITDDEKLLAKVTLLQGDVNRHIQLSEHMSEVLASGLEVLQSIYNNQLQVLNNRMAFVMTWFTILGTAVLVPNTLATILASPVFDLTSADIPWYVALLIGSTVVATLLAYSLVKRMGWLPSRVE